MKKTLGLMLGIGLGLMVNAQGQKIKHWSPYWNAERQIIYSELDSSGIENKISLVDSSRVKSKEYDYRILVDSTEIFKTNEKISDICVDENKNIVYTTEKKGKIWFDPRLAYNSDLYWEEKNYEEKILKNKGDCKFE